MNWLNRYVKSVRSFIKNIKKGKFKAIFRGIWDPEYRAQINHMVRLTTRADMILCHDHVSIRSIVPGHAINYPDWVDTLCEQIRSHGWKSIEPIKVIWDPDQGKWLVVDGNHRFEALKRSLPPYVKIPVRVLMEAEYSRSFSTVYGERS